MMNIHALLALAFIFGASNCRPTEDDGIQTRPQDIAVGVSKGSRAKITPLILHPMAKAIAGTNGKAIADTLSFAILKSGTKTQIEYNPDAVAIVGPGGMAHAENTLEIINYEMPSKTVLLPYYGAAKGQTLKINEFPNGTTTSIIRRTTNLIESILPEATNNKIRNIKTISPLVHSEQYAENLKNINNAALKLLEIQKNPDSPEKENYESIVELLSKSSEQLASFTDREEQRAGLDEWFSKKAGSGTKNKNEAGGSNSNKKVVTPAPTRGGSSNKIKGGEEENPNENEGVAVEPPAEESSIAEAKPVGLAIAGIGGMASSKPVATAVVGPGGLAVARPVATAIAGVSPDEALAPLSQRPSSSLQKPTTNKEDAKIANYSEYLNKLISKYHQV